MQTPSTPLKQLQPIRSPLNLQTITPNHQLPIKQLPDSQSYDIINSLPKQALETRVDTLLTEAYCQIDELGNQYGKNNGKLINISNEILSQYINSIYDKYRLEEPLRKIRRVRKQAGMKPLQNQPNQQTLEKLTKTNQKTDTIDRSRSDIQNRSKTLKKVYHLKQNIKTQLSDDKKIQTPNKNSPIQSNKQYPIATVVKKVKLKLKKNTKQDGNCDKGDKGKNQIQQVLFCFMCEEKIRVRSHQNHHYKFVEHSYRCREQISKFLAIFSPSLPPVPTLLMILTQKIAKSKQQLYNMNKVLLQQVGILQQKLDMAMNEEERAEPNQFKKHQIYDQCWQKMEYLQWIRSTKKLLESSKIEGMKVLGLIDPKI